MKLFLLFAFGALAFILPACTTVETAPPTTSTTTTTEEHTVRTPLGAASTSTTVRSY